MQEKREWALSRGRIDTIRFLLLAARDMRLLRMALEPVAQAISEDQIGAIVQKIIDQNPEKIAALAAPGAVATVKEVPAVAAAIAAAPAAKEVPAATAAITAAPTAQEATEKVVKGVAITGSLAGVAYVIWRIVARE